MNFSEFAKSNRIKGAIFDMDGTLTDSMGRWNEIYAELAQYLKIMLPQNFLMKVNHIPMRGRVKEILKEFSLEADEGEVYSYWVNKAAVYYEKVFKIKPYMLKALKELNALGVKAAVATASDRRLAEAFINSNSLTQYISSVTDLNEVIRPKSFPDIYLKAAEKLGLAPRECIVFEDSLTALKAAKSGGFKVCGVQDSCSEKDESEIKNLCEITLGF